MKNSIRLMISLLITFVINYRCDHIPNQFSDENNSGHPAITGKLMNSDNKSPSSGALVKLYSHNELVSISATTKKAASVWKKIVQTNSDGTFVIDSCAAGIYTIECTDKDGNAVRVDSVIVTDPKMTTDVSVKQLKSSGAVRGKVILDNGCDPSNVFILAFGSERFVQSRVDGTFLMEDLPYGDYTLKIIYIPGVAGDSKEISISIKPGETTDIGTVDLSSPICVPENLTVTLDSSKIGVNLKWDSCKDANVVGYYIHRYNVNEVEPVPGKEPNPASRITINKDPVATNYYTDYLVEIGEQYSYWVSAVTSDGRQGPMAGPVSVVPRSSFYSIDSIAYSKNRMPVTLRWKNTTSLQIATVEKDSSALGLDVYNDKLIFDHHSTIVNSRHNYSQIKIRDDYVLFIKNMIDSQINCYYINGTLRYSCALTFTTSFFNEKNDTLYIPGPGNIMMYDSSGTYLKNIINQQPLFATDGNMYLFNEDRHLVIPYSENISFLTKGIQLEYQESMRSWLWYASVRMYLSTSDFYGRRLIDVNSGWCILSSIPGLVIFDKQGTLRARLPGNSNKYDFSMTSVNANGAIAIIDRYSKVYVFTPKN